MFVLDQSPFYTWTVSVEMPTDGATGFESFAFTAHFKRLDRDGIKEVFSEPREDEEVCRMLLIGWSDIVDSKGAAVPYSEAAREKLLKILHMPGAIVRAWLESIKMEVKAGDEGVGKPQ